MIVELSNDVKILCKRHYYNSETKTYCDGNKCPEELRAKCIEKTANTQEAFDKNTMELNKIAEGIVGSVEVKTCH